MSYKKRTWISTKCTHPKAPVHMAIVWWLLLDRLEAPSWAFGVMWTIVAILALAFLVDVITGQGKVVPGFGDQD